MECVSQLTTPFHCFCFVLAIHRRNTYPDCKCDIAEVTLPPPTSPPPPAPPTPALAPQEAEQQQEGEEPARTCFCGYFSEVGTKHFLSVVYRPQALFTSKLQDPKKMKELGVNTNR